MGGVFISYSHEDGQTIDLIAHELQKLGYECWWDRSINPGEDFRARIDTQLEGAAAVLAIWSTYSCGSRWVRSEASFALDKEKLVQARIQQCALPRPFEQLDCANLSHWRGAGDDAEWRSLLAALARRTQPAPPQGAVAPRKIPSQAISARILRGRSAKELELVLTIESELYHLHHFVGQSGGDVLKVNGVECARCNGPVEADPNDPLGNTKAAWAELKNTIRNFKYSKYAFNLTHHNVALPVRLNIETLWDRFPSVRFRVEMFVDDRLVLLDVGS